MDTIDNSSIKVYLLDDVLAAVDTHVAKHIIKHCILGLLKHTTRIIVTENRILTYHADQVLHIENGTVKPSESTPEEYDNDDFLFDSDLASSSDMNVKSDADTKSVDSVMLEVVKMMLNVAWYTMADKFIFTGNQRVWYTVTRRSTFVLEINGWHIRAYGYFVGCTNAIHEKLV